MVSNEIPKQAVYCQFHEHSIQRILIQVHCTEITTCKLTPMSKQKDKQKEAERRDRTDCVPKTGREIKMTMTVTKNVPEWNAG